MRDVLDLVVPLLRAMPLATSLELRVAGASSRVVWTTSGRAYEAAQLAGAAAWAPDEFEAIALAVELERVTAKTFAHWCERKLIGRGIVVDARVAMLGAAGLVPYLERRGDVRVGRGKYESVVLGKLPREGAQQHTTLTFGRLFERIEVELLDVEVHAPIVKGAATSPAAAAVQWDAI